MQTHLNLGEVRGYKDQADNGEGKGVSKTPLATVRVMRDSENTRIFILTIDNQASRVRVKSELWALLQ